MTTVREVLELPQLRLRLRAGTSTGGAELDRAVSRIYGTELPDPGRYLSAGELLLSGLLWWREPGDAEPYVAALAGAGAAALAASGADSGGIPADLVAACERHRIPLLEVPADLSFAVVTEQVVLALAAGARGARKRLLSVAADASLPALLRHGATELDGPCWVISGLGRVIADSGTAPPSEVDELVRAVLGPGGPRPRHRGHLLLPVPGRRAVPWLLVVAGEQSAGRQEIAEELAGLVGLARSRADQVREVTDRAALPLLRLLAEGAGGELGPAFAATGLDAERPMRLVLTRTPGAQAGAELPRELLAAGDDRVLAGTHGTDAWALVQSAHWPADWAETATRALSTVENLVPGSRVLLGVGGPATVAGLRGAAEEARHAVVAAARGPERVAVVAGEDIGAHRLLLGGASDALRHTLRERVLGPLLAHDAEGRSDLLHTVRVFLDCSGSPAAAAKALHIHVNTLRYRLARAGDLLGRDLTDLREQVEVYLALCIEG